MNKGQTPNKGQSKTEAGKSNPAPAALSSQPPIRWANNYPRDGILDPHAACVEWTGARCCFSAPGPTL